jgi:large subunit ribosomal protein L31e
MAKEEKKPELEREYIIPLRREFEKVPRYRRGNKAISAIKKFLVRHMKIRDGDTNKIKLDRYLNEEVWHRGIRKPPIKIKVKVVKESDTGIVRVELAELPEKLKFKKAREEKRETKGAEVAKKKKEEKKEIEETTEEKTKEEIKEGEEKKENEKEKAGATEEAMESMEKQTAKQAKHKSVAKVKMPKHQFRQALQK